MTQEEKYKIISNDYTDLFIEYNRNPNLLERFQDSSIHTMNTRYALAYVPSNQLNDNFIKEHGYSPIPHCYGLTSIKSLESSGVQKLRRTPTLDLRGQGVLIGVIDTGIDYTNTIFIKGDGTSKVVRLWDQTIDSENQYPKTDYQFYYGTEYTQEQLNQALKSNKPYDIVPSTDTIGHGTMMAGVAAGSEVPEQNFSGVVPDSDLIVVKLKQAKPVLREFFGIPLDVPCYQENDIMWALQYIFSIARVLRRPVAICIGLGTSQGSHDGRGPLNNLIDILADIPGITISISAGNEGSMNRHFYSPIASTVGYQTVELKVGEKEHGFSMEIWGNTPNTYSIDILSPTGEYIPRIAESLNTNQQVSFIFESTIINLDYQIVETHSGDQLILLRFTNPTPGIWRFRVYTRGDLQGSFHSWLPMNGFISVNTFFTAADPFTTVTGPGNTFVPITVTAYNPESEALYLNASKGYTRDLTVKPELAAPGVNVVVPALDQRFINASGTSIAAAHTAGISAMLLEWGVVRGNYSNLDSIKIKKFLIRGAKRNTQIKYPNRDWGFGIIDVYNVFNVLK